MRLRLTRNVDSTQSIKFPEMDEARNVSDNGTFQVTKEEGEQLIKNDRPVEEVE